MAWPLIAAAALGALGGSAGGLSRSKIKPYYYNKDLSTSLSGFIPLLGQDQPIYEAALGDYAAREARRAADVERLGGLAETDYNKLLGTVTAPGYDPLATYETLRAGNLGALKGFAGDIADVGRARQNLALAALGRGARGGGGAGGTYEQILTQDRIARALAPQFGNIIAGLTPATQAIGAGRLANIGSAQGLIGARTGTGMLGEGLELGPIEARLGTRAGQADLYRALADAARANTAGYQEIKNWAGNLASGLQTGVGIFGGVLGGLGGGGGGAGGLGGLLGGG